MLLHLQAHIVGNPGRALLTACAMPALLLVYHVEAPAPHVRHIAQLWPASWAAVKFQPGSCG